MYVCIYVCMYVFMYLYVCIYIDIYTHGRVHGACIRVNVCVCVCVCVCVWYVPVHPRRCTFWKGGWYRYTRPITPLYKPRKCQTSNYRRLCPFSGAFGISPSLDSFVSSVRFVSFSRSFRLLFSPSSLCSSSFFPFEFRFLRRHNDTRYRETIVLGHLPCNV